MKKKHILLILAAMIAVAVFFLLKKKAPPATTPAEKKKDSVVTSGIKSLVATTVFFNDMENPDPALWIGDKNSEKYFSGKFSSKLDDKTEYGITLFKNVSDIPHHEKIKQVKISYRVYSAQPLKGTGWVYSISGEKGKMYEYFKEDLKGEPGKWSAQEFYLQVNPGLWQSDGTLKIYPWNPGKEILFVDDIRIEFYAEVERRAGIVLGPQQNYFFDFETDDASSPHNDRSVDFAHSGKYSLKLGGVDSYSESILKKVSDVTADSLQFISMSAWIYPKDDEANVAFVASVDKPDGTSVTWQGKSTDHMNLEKNSWHKVNFRADLRGIKTDPDDVIKIYFWNKKSVTVYVDDLEIVYGDIPKPAGLVAGMVMNLSGDPETHAEKNKPPFAPQYFSAATQFVSANNFLCPEKGKESGEMNPASVTVCGNFLGQRNAPDEIFIADKNNWSLYAWCDEKKFVQLCSTKATEIATGKVVLTGYFSSDRQQEILLVDTENSVSIREIQFRNGSATICDQKNSTEINSATSTVSGLDFKNKSIKIVSGNFTGDDRDEIIFMSATGEWKLAGFNGNSWTIIQSGNVSRGNILNVYSVNMADAHDRLLAFSERNQKLDYCLIDFSKGKNGVESEFKDKSFLSNYNSSSTFFSGSFEKRGSHDLFYLDSEWRFDLKKVNLSTQGIFIESQIDFHQPDPNRNPKFYEFTKLIPGKFFAGNSDCLLIQMRNCKDNDFDGRTCSEFEEVKGMPSGFLFYQYNPAEK